MLLKLHSKPFTKINELFSHLQERAIALLTLSAASFTFFFCHNGIVELASHWVPLCHLSRDAFNFLALLLVLLLKIALNLIEIIHANIGPLEDLSERFARILLNEARNMINYANSILLYEHCVIAY